MSSPKEASNQGLCKYKNTHEHSDMSDENETGFSNRKEKQAQHYVLTTFLYAYIKFRIGSLAVVFLRGLE
jgi:hypothetical protein